MSTREEARPIANDTVTWATSEAERLLGPAGSRFSHVRGVASIAEAIQGAVSEEDRPILLAVAWLHDIGYAPGLRETGAHQLDGARYLHALGLDRLARLVANHSASRYELEARGLGGELSAYPHEESAVDDALTYCDLQTGPKRRRNDLGRARGRGRGTLRRGSGGPGAAPGLR